MDASVRALAVSGTNLYAGGYFTNAGGVPANYIAKWDRSAWSALGEGVNGSISALAVSGTNLYVGGGFSTAGGVPVNGIAKWDGSAWSALGDGVNGSVYALSVSGTNLYAGGWFPTAGGVVANHIAKWDGSAWSPLGSGMSWSLPYTGPWISSLAVSGTALYAGGSFSTAGGVRANCVARWDGSAWSALGSGVGGFYFSDVYALAVSGTNLYAAGQFSNAGGVPANCIAKWDGSAWSALGSGMGDTYPWVYALAADGLGHLFVGGQFTLAGTNVSPFIAQANIATSPPEAPHLQNCRLDAGQFGFDLDGQAGRKLLLQASSDLKHWVTLRACQLTNSPLGFIDPESHLYRKRFYRLMAAEGVAMMEEPRWLGSQFNLNLVGELGRTVVIEGSTNLANWAPLATNLLGSDPIPFTDPESSQFSQRFYRLMLR
jgi:hypothetical protein